jgi:hypothetical protein
MEESVSVVHSGLLKKMPMVRRTVRERIKI